MITLDDNEEVRDEVGLDDFHELILKKLRLEYRIKNYIFSKLLTKSNNITNYLEKRLAKIERLEYIRSSVPDDELNRLASAANKINDEALKTFSSITLKQALINTGLLCTIDYDLLSCRLKEIEKQNSFFGKLKRRIASWVRNIKTKSGLGETVTVREPVYTINNFKEKTFDNQIVKPIEFLDDNDC